MKILFRLVMYLQWKGRLLIPAQLVEIKDFANRDCAARRVGGCLFQRVSKMSD